MTHAGADLARLLRIRRVDKMIDLGEKIVTCMMNREHPFDSRSAQREQPEKEARA